MKKNQYAKIALRCPPRCVRDIPLTTAPDWVENDEHCAVFGIPEVASILGALVWDDYRGGNVFTGPLAVVTEHWHATVFEPRVHGYNGELGCPTLLCGDGPDTRYVCLDCGAAHFDIALAFSYEIDDLTDEVIGDVQLSDLFDAFEVHGRCHVCRRIQNIVSFECA